MKPLFVFLFLSFTCCSITVKMDYQWTYKDQVRPQTADAEVVKPLVKLCCEQVSDYLGVSPLDVEVTLAKELQGRMCYHNKKVHINLFHKNSKIYLDHLDFFCRVLVHELSEWTLGAEKFQGGTLYNSDFCNRWIGEGVSEYVASQARAEAKRRGYPLPERDRFRLNDLKGALHKGVLRIGLNEWKVRKANTPRNSSLKESLRYACSEYLINQWVKAAKERGLESPTKELRRWLLNNTCPTNEEITSWMEEVSGLNLQKMSGSVPIRDVLKAFEKPF